MYASAALAAAPSRGADAVATVEATSAEDPMVAAVMAQHPPSADWYFVLDTSGEMLAVAQAARADIAKLIEVIPEGDRVAVMAMHTRPSEALPLSAIDHFNRQTLMDKVATLDLTSAKDADLGGGLSWAVHHLSAKTAADLSFVVMAGPFCHSPSVSSDFDSGGRGCRPIRGIDKIASSYAESRGARKVEATLLTLAPPGGASDPVGLEAVRKVFPEATVVDGKTVSFAAWAEDFRKRLPLHRVMPLVSGDVSAAGLKLVVAGAPTAEHPVARVILSAGTQHLGLRVHDLVINGVHYPDGDLAPSVMHDIPVTLPPAPFQLWPGVETLEVPITATASGEILPADGLRAVGIDPARPALTASINATVERDVGPSYLRLSTLSVLGVLFVSLASVYAQVRGRTSALEGAFSYRRVGASRQALDVSGRSAVAICKGPEGDLVVGAERDAVVIFRMVKSNKAADAEIVVCREGVQVNSKPVPKGVHKVVPGATSVQFDDFRLTWE